MTGDGRASRQPARIWVVLAAAVLVSLVAILALPTSPQPISSPAASVAASSTPDPSGPLASRPTAEPTPPPTGDAISRTVHVEQERTRGPFGNRIRPSGVWTGTEVIVWGGWIGRPLGVGQPQADGAAYDPTRDRWRTIAEPPIPGSADHLATWTGREMLVWGGWAGPRPRPKPEGAAFDPTTDTWWRMAAPPIRWGSWPDSVWTGEEWVIAMNRPEVIVVVAYDPDDDSWRRLPDIAGDLGDEIELLWTGSELLLIAGTAGLHRLSPDGASWIRSESQVLGSGAITVGGRVVALDQELGLVEWQATSDSLITIARPPRPVQAWGLSAIGNDRLVFGSELDGRVPDLLVDLGSGEWSELAWPEPEDREDHLQLWVGDDLFIWGGWIGGPTGRPPYQYGVLYTPDW
jgi:hypothetical protein